MPSGRRNKRPDPPPPVLFLTEAWGGSWSPTQSGSAATKCCRWPMFTPMAKTNGCQTTTGFSELPLRVGSPYKGLFDHP